MKPVKAILLALFVFALAPETHAATTWAQGKHYSLLTPAQRTTVPAGKVEVMEVFSYGCPFCNTFQPVLERLKSGLPANAQMVFLPASFNPSEDWPMFQRAYFAAQSLGVAERTHQAVYDAIWRTGELSLQDPITHRLKAKTDLPTIEDAAKCYGRLTGVKPAAFLAAAKSFGVEAKMRAADAQIKAMAVPSTPCIVVNGKYRVNFDSLSNTGELIELVKFLVAKETPG
jgi:protein dithiol oxidoreductase (disulfide-forming)